MPACERFLSNYRECDEAAYFQSGNSGKKKSFGSTPLLYVDFGLKKIKAKAKERLNTYFSLDEK